MRVGITGIGGFVGAELCRACLNLGWNVRGIDQDHRALRRLPENPLLETQVATLNDMGALLWMAIGADLVVHTAAMVEEDGDWNVFRQVNVEGTQAVVKACKSADVATVVHFSSVMVYGFDYPEMVDETHPLGWVDNPYCQTKIESEQAALAQGHPRVVIVRPGDIYGWGSKPWVDRPLAWMKKGAFVLPSEGLGKLNPIFIEDLIQGILQAAKHGASGVAYNLTAGQSVDVREYFQRLAHAFGGGCSVRFVPRAIVINALELAAKIPGLRNDVPSTTTLKFLQRSGSYSIDRARKALGFEPDLDLTRGLESLRDCRYV